MNTSDITKIATERRNPRSRDIDRLTTAEMVSLINSEDKKVADAVEKVCPQIAAAIDLIYARMKRGGRLIYCGCGTSGRLGILDASECPPTYSVSPETVQAVIAGGKGAVFNAVEGAEDSAELGKEDMLKLALTENDTLVGIAASGRTPYVLGAMKAARDAGAGVIGLTCCPGSAIDAAADIGIAPQPGPEVVTGSTRHGTRGHHRLDPHVVRHGSEDGAEYALHLHDGQARQGVRQPHGRCKALEREACAPLHLHRARSDRRG